jgi:hypothetical protein
MRRQPIQDILDVRKRIDLETLAAPHQSGQGGRSPAAPITPDEHVVLPTDRLRGSTGWREGDGSAERLRMFGIDFH